ncbi:MafB-like protein [Flavobacterium branchiophilum]|uniref:MafB-like protein n=1 Tax=Flavobacterium branchiophilum TaxID=55197 RepID=A0A2H3KE72_9FLAO|nr:polymorphic toxin-type HINT domain-containing protein [Flavobacterium branchiophilum]PDS26400.1 MafB-like protein [Flavobacterium branchiophilum]
MDELEYITKDALMMCDQGGAPDFFKPTYNDKVKIHGCLVATTKDAVPLSNIPSFKICKVTQKPCMPATVPLTWQDTWQVKINGKNSLIGKSTCQCPIGGKIEFMTSGQVPMPADAMAEVKEMQEQAQRELDDSGNGDSIGEAGFAEGLIPVWGSGRDLINDIQTGDGLGAVMNAGFLIWDVASIAAGCVTFGAATAAMQGAKTGLKATLKAGGKVIKNSALKALGKVGLKKLSKEALKNSIDDVAKKLLKTCVFACFPAGTLIQTQHGTKPIEDIQIGDLVWAYDEDTNTTALQPVVDIMENETDHTISLYTETEVIETTATHPFYTQDGWKDASELQAGDQIKTQNHENVEITATQFNYEPKKVYNFTVGNFHTYFVGLRAWLVHNAKKCVSKVVEQVINWSTKSTKTFGHAFLKHGEKNLKKLIEIARQKKIPQGMWKNNEQAAEIIKKNFDNLIEGENIIDIPKGIGQVINPDGSIIEATKAIVVKNADGATNILTTAYPKIIP